MLWIPGELEKGNQDRILPMAPEFAEFLRETPVADRNGYVFNPLPRKLGYAQRLKACHVGRLVERIGKAASVKVDTNRGNVKFASAHDLRRSFGERWSLKVMPQVLQELMRHEDISTTLRYYVGSNAKRTSAVLWQAYRQGFSLEDSKQQAAKMDDKITQ